jgi:hypothetical protein
MVTLNHSPTGGYDEGLRPVGQENIGALSRNAVQFEKAVFDDVVTTFVMFTRVSFMLK